MYFKFHLAYQWAIGLAGNEEMADNDYCQNNMNFY